MVRVVKMSVTDYLFSGIDMGVGELNTREKDAHDNPNDPIITFTAPSFLLSWRPFLKDFQELTELERLAHVVIHS